MFMRQGTRLHAVMCMEDNLYTGYEKDLTYLSKVNARVLEGMAIVMFGEKISFHGFLMKQAGLHTDIT